MFEIAALPDRRRQRQIFTIALPMIGSMAVHALLQAMDMLFVGFLGTTALAAVGISSFSSFVYISLFGGVSVAVQGMTARLLGEGDYEHLGKFLNTGLVVVGLFAPVTSALFILLSPQILDFMNRDPAVISIGTPYLRWLFAATTFHAVNMAFMGYWNAISRTDIFFRLVMLQSIVNIPMNYVFMFGMGLIPAFGVEGAGIGTFIAAAVGLAGNILYGLLHLGAAQLMPRWPEWAQVLILLRIMVPAGLQQFFENLGLTLLFRIVALIGTVELATHSVLVNLIGMVGIPAWAMGAAGITLVGQAMGKRDPDDAHRWAWDTIKVGVLGIAALGAPLWLVPELVLGLFIHEEETLAMAILPCRIMGVMIAINGIGYMFANMLNSAGFARQVMYINLVTQYVILLPGAYLVGVYWGYGYVGVWLIHQLGFRAFNSVILTVMWERRKWTQVSFW